MGTHAALYEVSLNDMKIHGLSFYIPGLKCQDFGFDICMWDDVHCRKIQGMIKRLSRNLVIHKIDKDEAKRKSRDLIFAKGVSFWC